MPPLLWAEKSFMCGLSSLWLFLLPPKVIPEQHYNSYSIMDSLFDPKSLFDLFCLSQASLQALPDLINREVVITNSDKWQPSIYLMLETKSLKQKHKNEGLICSSWGFLYPVYSSEWLILEAWGFWGVDCEIYLSIIFSRLCRQGTI